MLFQLSRFVVEACPIVARLFLERKSIREDLIVLRTHHPQMLSECKQPNQWMAIEHGFVAGGD